MPIDLAAAEKISNVTVFGFGFGLVFVGLICIILICMLMGFLCKNLIKEEKPVEAVKPAMNPAQMSKSAKASGEIADRGAFVAAVSAALAEELGTDVSGIRILSIKKM